MKNARMLIYDWNNTVLDDMLVWYGAVCEIFRVFQKIPPSMQEWFQEFCGDYLAVYRSRGIEASRDELNRIYTDYYKLHSDEAKLFPDARIALQSFRLQNRTLGLLTAQHEELADPLLKKFRLLRTFDSVGFHVLNKQEALMRIVQEVGIAPHECCYIGDAPSDIRHGRAAGVMTAAFLGKYYIPGDLLVKEQPDMMFRNYVEMMRYFSRP